MRHKRKPAYRAGKLYGLAIIAILLTASGCSDPYRASLSGSAKVSDAVHEAIGVTSNYYSQGKLTDSEKSVIASYLDNVTDANMNYRHAVVALHNAGVTGPEAYIQQAQAFVNAVPTDPLAFHYKSQDSQQKFNTVLGEVKSSISLIALTVQNAKGTIK